MKIHKELLTCLDIFSVIDKRLKIGMFSINVAPRGEGIINVRVSMAPECVGGNRDI